MDRTGADDDIPIVDAHQHFWDPVSNSIPWLSGPPLPAFRWGDYTAIRRPYLPADYRRDSAGHRVVATVHVETEWNPADPLGETRWLEALADRHGVPTVLVGQAWLDRADVAEVLAGQARSPLMRGIRHKPTSVADPRDARRGAPGSMDDEAWRAGYALLARHGLHFELQTPWWHLDAACDLARDFPATPIIVNHAGMPTGRDGAARAGWRAAMERLSRHPQVAVKISGIGLRGQAWSLAINGGVIADVIGIFGAERSMFASNFPVDSLIGPFDTIYTGFKRATAHLPTETRRALFHDTARRLYRMPG
jgi:predicted TIM-barrel fold metal-dependent hydrolase